MKGYYSLIFLVFALCNSIEAKDLCCKFIKFLINNFLFFSLKYVHKMIAKSLVIPCAIIRGPNSNAYLSYGETTTTKEFYCQFSKKSNEDHISNYNWFIDDVSQGDVNNNFQNKKYLEISYDEKLKQLNILLFFLY